MYSLIRGGHVLTRLQWYSGNLKPAFLWWTNAESRGPATAKPLQASQLWQSMRNGMEF